MSLTNNSLGSNTTFLRRQRDLFADFSYNNEIGQLHARNFSRDGKDESEEGMSANNHSKVLIRSFMMSQSDGIQSVIQEEDEDKEEGPEIIMQNMDDSSDIRKTEPLLTTQSNTNRVSIQGHGLEPAQSMATM